jgi:hypothetical protein
MECRRRQSRLGYSRERDHARAKICQHPVSFCSRTRGRTFHSSVPWRYCVGAAAVGAAAAGAAYYGYNRSCYEAYGNYICGY